MSQCPPRRVGLTPLLVAALAAACLVGGLRSLGAAAEQRALYAPAEEGRSAASAAGGARHVAAPPRAPSIEPLSGAAPSPPSDDPVAAPLRAAAPADAIAAGGGSAAPYAGGPPGAGFATARFPTGPPPAA